MATKTPSAKKADPVKDAKSKMVAATKKAVAAKAAPAKTSKAAPAKVSKVVKSTPKAEPLNAKEAPPKAAKAALAKVTAVEVPEVENESVGRKTLAEGVRARMKVKGFGVTPKLTLALVESFEECIVSVLASGVDVVLPGFGKFKVAPKAAAIRKNPQTGEDVQVPASMSVSFKVGKAMKAAANLRPDDGATSLSAVADALTRPLPTGTPETEA